MTEEAPRRRAYCPDVKGIPSGWKFDWTPADGDDLWLLPPDPKVRYVVTLNPDEHSVQFFEAFERAERRDMPGSDL